MRLAQKILGWALAMATVLSFAAPMTSADQGIHLSSSRMLASTNPIAQHYPKQWAATQGSSPDSRHWALIIGITEYQSPTRNTVGGAHDALELQRFLLSQGWRSDHILVIRDKRATKKNVVAGLAWLRNKARVNSTVVFGYAGHEMPFSTSSDGDNEARDVALHLTDNRYLLDGDLGKKLGAVRYKKMWIHFATCRAQGFSDKGTIKPNRVVTYSSTVGQLSYEDPAVGQSVFGNYAVTEGMRAGLADANDDGQVSVEEAFLYANPRVKERTDNRQHPRLVDKFPGQMKLRPAKA